ncbi:hypothetical protein VNI00_002269 [Paramarasmius palmivorus]|uniref:Uncharacterized protein n=1 Tax=Paramarasmius palmivorus TaxID=297713 RepID=A0AAW0E2V0_9AGAR
MSLDSGMPQLKALSPPPRRRPRTSPQESRTRGSGSFPRPISPYFELVNQPNPYINPAPTMQELTSVQEAEEDQPNNRSDCRETRANSHAHTTFSTTVSPTTTTTPRTTRTMTTNKPPIPSSPKPDFSAFRSAQKHQPNSPESPSFDHNLPPTTNHLNSHQRSDLVRKSRKLAQVFGQTPAAGTLAKQGQSFLDIPSAGSSSPLTKHRYHRAAHSISSDIDRTTGSSTNSRRDNWPGPIWPPPQGTQYITASGRRHSTPLTPDQFSFLSEPATDEYDNRSQHSSELNIEISSTHEGTAFHDDASFIDLSDGDEKNHSNNKPRKGTTTTTTAIPVDDSMASPSEDFRSIAREQNPDSLSAYSTSPHHDQHSSSKTESPYQRTVDLSRSEFGHRRKSLPDLPPPSPNETCISDLSSSLNTSDGLSICESLSPEAQAEEEKRRRREKLAKLHRFLGSRVPTDLVIGELGDPALPPLAPSDALRMVEGYGDDKKWMKRRRSSSAAVFPAWSDDLDRLKEGLSNEEKAINVRRAQKMEKVFGVAPPQTLYHTRHSPSLSVAPAGGVSAPRSMLRSSSGDTVTPPTKNINQSSYASFSNYKSKKKSDRPGTADSEEKLLPKESSSGDTSSKGKQADKNYNTFGNADGSTRRARGASLVYTHYQHSLNSLNDILDRDDRASLAELHQFLNGPDVHADLIDLETENVECRDPERDYARDLELFHSGKGKDAASPTDVGLSKRASVASSIRSERRRSLPTPVTGARNSFLSFESTSPERAYGHARSYRKRTDSIISRSDSLLSPEGDEFQMRRRKAAKLTQFFGVNYRDLIRDVLESIEGGLEAERKKGTVSKEEAEDLLQKLRTIKTKRGGLFNS